MELQVQVPVMVKAREWAKLYGVSYATVARMLKDGQLPGAVKVRNTWRIPADALMPKGGDER